jgi:hypothetical protein
VRNELTFVAVLGNGAWFPGVAPLMKDERDERLNMMIKLPFFFQVLFQKSNILV